MASLAVVYDIIAKDKASRELNNIGAAAENTGRKGETLKKGLAIAAKAAVAVGAASAVAGVKLFNHGAALEAMGNKANTVFGDQIGVVEKWAKANAAGMGLSSREATGLAASFGDLLIPMGFTRDQAAKMSTDVVGLSGALSQWSGGQTSAAEAADILAKAMLGERDGLKSLGISISEADVQARLLKNGTDGLTGAALEQAKATATQELIFEKSTDAQAAYEKGGNKLLTAQNQLKAKFKEVFDELSIRLIPVFTRLSTWVVEKGVPAADRLYQQFNRNVLPILKSVASFVSGTVVPTLRVFGEWVVRNKDFLIPFVAVVAAAVAGFKVYVTIQKAVIAVTAAWNAVLLLNPIGIVVVAVAALAAALVVAYNRSDRFRAVVDRVWASLKTAGGWVVDTGTKVQVWIVSKFTTAKARLDSFIAKMHSFRLPGWVSTLGSALGAIGGGLKRGFDALKGGVGDGPGVGGKPGQHPGVARMMSMLPPGTRLISGLRPGAITATGNSSYHARGRAVDIPPSMALFNYIKSRFGAVSKELIFSPAGDRQVHNGREHYYKGVTRANHFDHIHWAMDQGGVANGIGFMPKLTSRPERVLSPDQTSAFERLVDVLDRGGDTGALLAAVEGLRADIRALPRQYQLAVRAGA